MLVVGGAMSRKLRIEYPGAMYHVMNRGGHLPAPQRSRQAGRAGYMSLKWIAQRLQMGSWTCVSNLLNEPPQTHPQG